MSHTGNPHHPNNPPSDYPSEPTGAVTKDSLASESINAGGAFADNDNPAVMGVKGSQSTLANDDTSNAQTLPPAASGAARDQAYLAGQGSDERGVSGTLYPDAGANQTSSYGGTTSDQGYRGGSGDPTLAPQGSSYDKPTLSSSSRAGAFDDAPSRASGGPDPNISSSAAGVGARPYVETAPNYAATENVRSDGTYQPKGTNISEDNDIPAHRSTFTGDVGGPNDPGRLAEQTFQKDAYDSSAGLVRDYGDGQKQGNAYDELNPSERA